MAETQFDILIRNTTIYDGNGAAPVRGAIAIRGERIAAVGNIQGKGGVEIDGARYAVAPGFIDVHSHDDFIAFIEPKMDFKVMQGVTTDIVGNCGLGAAPYPAARVVFHAFHGGAEVREWNGYRGYLEAVDRDPPSLNIAVLAGHGTIRASVMGNEPREASAHEIAEMRKLVREAIDAGAVGLSTGLIYEPGRWAKTEEIIELAREMTGSGALYASHMRNEAKRLEESVRETIRIGAEANVAVEISHHKASGRENWGKVRRTLEMIDEARAKGLDVTADQYPYTSASTSLAAVLQNVALDEGGLGELRQEELEQIMIASAPRHPEWEGKNLAQLAETFATDGMTAAKRVVNEEGLGAIVVIQSMCEPDVRTVMAHPTTMIGSDGLAMGSKPHPRLYGCFPRVLGHYARAEGLLKMEQAVHKMTGMPAKKFRLEDRGEIRAGAFADLVLFDPAAILDTATYEDPRRYPAGIAYVFVNGAAVVKDGRHTGARPGRGLRRT